MALVKREQQKSVSDKRRWLILVALTLAVRNTGVFVAVNEHYINVGMVIYMHGMRFHACESILDV